MKAKKVLFITQEIIPYVPETELSKIVCGLLISENSKRKEVV